MDEDSDRISLDTPVKSAAPNDKNATTPSTPTTATTSHIDPSTTQRQSGAESSSTPAFQGSVFTWVTQQLREEVGFASPTEHPEVVLATRQLEELRSQQHELLEQVGQLRERYLTLTEALVAMGSTLYEIGIAETEGLRAPCIATGEVLRQLGQLGVHVDLDAQLSLVTAAFVTSAKVVQDARDTREAYRKARLLHDGILLLLQSCYCWVVFIDFLSRIGSPG
jgi:hypothetical protein